MLPLYFFVPRAISMIDTVSWLRSIPRCSAPKWSSTTRWRGVPAHVTPPRHDIEIEHAISISPFFLSAHWNPHQFGGHGWSAGAHSRDGHQQRVSPFNILKAWLVNLALLIRFASSVCVFSLVTSLSNFSPGSFQLTVELFDYMDVELKLAETGKNPTPIKHELCSFRSVVLWRHPKWSLFPLPHLMRKGVSVMWPPLNLFPTSFSP